MKSVKTFLLAGATAAFILTCAADTTRDAALERGSAFLKSCQQADGHWSDPHMPALTALPVWALVSGGEATRMGFGPSFDAAISNAVKFVLASQQSDGGFYHRKPGRGGGGLGVYNTSVCLSALHLSGLSPSRAILDARSYLAGAQLTGDDTMAGGFGYDRINPNRSSRRRADLSNTSYALSAMKLTAGAEEMRPGTERRVDVDWNKAIAFVERLQSNVGEDRGGATYNPGMPQAGTSTNAQGRVHLRAYGSMSYAAVLSLCCADLTKADPRVRMSLEYCTKYWNVDENPGMGNQGLYYYYDILSRALSASQVEELAATDGRKIAWKRELEKKILSLQKPNGSWANDNNRFWEADEVLCTSFAMIALSLCR